MKKQKEQKFKVESGEKSSTVCTDEMEKMIRIVKQREENRLLKKFTRAKKNYLNKKKKVSRVVDEKEQVGKQLSRSMREELQIKGANMGSHIFHTVNFYM